MIGCKTGRHLGTLGNGPVAEDQDIDVPEYLTQPPENSLPAFDLAQLRESSRIVLAKAFRDLGR